MKKSLKSKCLCFLLLMSSVPMSIMASAQNQRVSLEFSKAPLTKVLEEIGRQTATPVVYNIADVENAHDVSVTAKNESVVKVLNRVLKGTSVTYSFANGHIVLSKARTAVNAPAQSKKVITVKGNVVDAAGEPLIGVSVLVKGTTNGAVTDLDGNFTLEASEGAMLEISYIGYSTQTVAATAAPIKVVMKEDSEQLEEVVVTALGIKRSEKALSYNVQQVSGDELSTIKDANFVSSLNGKVAGVTINSSSTAGGASRVVMRGVKSISSNNLALYVIDGVPMFNMMNGGDGGGIFSTQPGTDGVADINPEDIESISMLTGPSAAALYGNAAAAGVVLITTKKGTKDKTTVTVSNNTTFSKVTMLPEMQSKYGNLPSVNSSWGPIVNSSYDPEGFFRTGANIINNVSLSTGNQKNQTYFSASTTNTSNILPNSGYNRYNFSVRNTTSFLNDKMTLDAGASYIIQNDKNMVSQGYYNNPLPAIYRFPRSENFDDVRMFERYNSSYDLMEQFWPYGDISSGLANPYWIQNRQLRENHKTRYMINASLKYQIFDWFDVTGRVKVDNYENRYTEKVYASTGKLDNGDRGSYSDILSRSKNIYADVIGTVNKRFNDWSVNVNLGASLNDSQYETIGYSGGLKNANFFAVHNINFKEAWKAKQSGWHDHKRALFVNAEIGWKSMLYLTASGRNDWDSKLAFSDYKCFFYPSIGMSAILSEAFHMPEWMTFLKVRGSYTEVGNAYGRFMTRITYPYDEQSQSWNPTTRYPNVKLKPERTKSWEVGLDARFFNDFSLNFTYYRSNTFNQTFNAGLSSTSGYSTIPLQSGNILNEGIEMAVGYDKKWKDFSFNTSYTLTWNRNEVKELADKVYNYFDGSLLTLPELEMAKYGQTDARLLLRVGGTMGDVYSSRVLKRDLNGYILNDPETGLDVENKENYLGSILPKVNMGWNLGFGYKGLHLGMTFTARLGGIVISETQSNLDAAGVSKATADARDAGGVLINQSRVDAKEYYTTIAGNAYYYTYSANNVRLGELSLNYTLPKKWFNNKMAMTVGFVGKNLWMIYCKAPFDPELTTSAGSNFYQGFDAYMLPNTRNLGFNVKFQF